MYLLTQGQLKHNNVIRIVCPCRKFWTTIWKTILWRLLTFKTPQVLVLTCITFVTFRTLLLPQLLWKHTHCPNIYLMGERMGTWTQKPTHVTVKLYVFQVFLPKMDNLQESLNSSATNNNQNEPNNTINITTDVLLKH
jgi:hypothetical protein